MPLRALKTNDELMAVPLDEPVLVELPSLPGTELEIDAGKQVDPPKDDDPVKSLQSQIDAQKAATEAANARAEKAEREAAEARRLAKERDDENRKLQEGRAEDEGAIIQNALAAAQAEQASAQAEYEKAFEDGNAKAAAAAQIKLGRAAAKIVRYEEAAAQHAADVERVKTAPKPKTEDPPAAIDPVAAIDANPQLLPSEKAWLKSHLDAWTNPRKNQELSVAYNRSIDAGHARGSAEQFKFIEEFMGYAKPNNTGDDNVSVSAPPSRQDRGGDGRPVSTKITLSPEEREIARSMGISDIDYARNKVKMLEDQRADPAKYGMRG